MPVLELEHWNTSAPHVALTKPAARSKLIGVGARTNVPRTETHGPPALMLSVRIQGAWFGPATATVQRTTRVGASARPPDGRSSRGELTIHQHTSVIAIIRNRWMRARRSCASWCWAERPLLLAPQPTPGVDETAQRVQATAVTRVRERLRASPSRTIALRVRRASGVGVPRSQSARWLRALLGHWRLVRRSFAPFSRACTRAARSLPLYDHCTTTKQVGALPASLQA